MECALDCVDADTSDAHDDGDVAGFDRGAVDRRAPSGGDAATGEAGLGQGEVVRNLGAADGGDDGVLREGGDEGHLPDVRTVLMHPEGAVELSPGQEQCTRVAEVLLPAGAPAAAGSSRG